MTKKKILALLSVFLFYSGTANAAELDAFFKGSRPLGMGNAFTAIADDENAVFYNPAGLNSVKKGRVEIINPLISYSQDSMDFFSDISDLDPNDVTAATDVLRKHMGKQQSVRLSVFPNYTRHNFEIGALGQLDAKATIHQPSYPYIDVDAGGDGGAVVGIARSYDFREADYLQLGISAMVMQRQGISRTYTAADIASEDYDISDDLKTGTGLGINIGAIYNFKETPIVEPSIALAIQNVGGMDYGADIGEEKMSVNLGFAFNREFPLGKAVFAIDYLDLLNNVGEDDDIAKRLHMGAEIKFVKILTLRAGLNQGYGTIGATIDFWLIKFTYAMYTEEAGAYAGQNSDQRHVFQLSLGF